MGIGRVFLIGAGPGDPGLLTLRGADRLGKADVVLYDGLSNVDLLAHAPHAEHICVGKHGQSRIWKQPEIIAEMLAHAVAGKTVARLKGGDPAVFARTSEEVDALREAEIDFEIVPGITAALAAGSFAGIPITHRRLASAVALVTGHEEPGKVESALDWQALANFPGTLVVYMGVTTAQAWTNSLIQAGKDPATSAAIIRRCSLPDQQAIHCRLDEVAGHLTPASKFRPPVITIIGPVTELAESMDWVTRRPLHGQTVLVTRPIDKAESLAGPLRDLGAHVLVHPAIKTGPVKDRTELQQVTDRFDEFDAVIFCSENGVRYFMDHFTQQSNADIRSFAGKLIGCIGSKTANRLFQDYHLRTDVVPQDFSAESLADAIADELAGKQVLVIRASRGADTLPVLLTQSGAIVHQVIAYENSDVEKADPAVIDSMRDGNIDWTTITSSATAESLSRMFGDALTKTKIASLSPITSTAVRKAGLEISAEANPYTIDSLIEQILKS
ncbi:Uroporphyrinogen-III C-methyltransferase [Rubripirellula obstinata]|uniref:uroporphyrinogen-III C-methyltransferase n=1 Tax=Rubripirellula obstinata TaxID=406547 RepID=A0A5B1CK55_9BACT|nr:uroporphyrinogen-III C-methyltransferase [Rubripirellula obstinata]KAA1260682.1 Uroporphyrinogen-III C-methyltransferase [Rubripirellula obstinata]